MAKRKPSSRKVTSGSGAGVPICIALVPCERVLVDKDNVVSAIRIVDTITLSKITPAGAKANIEGAAVMVGDSASGSPDLMELVTLRLLAILKNGDAKGQLVIGVVSVDESGRRVPLGLAQANFDGPPEGGSNLVVPIRLGWSGPGLYWIELTVNDTVFAKTPIRIKLDESEANKTSKATEKKQGK